MTDKLPQVTRIDFTDRERHLLVKVFDVAATLCLSLQGCKGDESDADAVKFVMDRPGEVAALLTKINADRVGAKDVLETVIMDTFEDMAVSARLLRMKRQMQMVALAKPEVAAKSALRRDMEWLITELEKRL